MPTITEQLTQLVSDKNDLINNLETKGITGLTGDETFTELVPKVLNVPSGEDLSEYFTGTIEKGKYAGGENIAGVQHAIKKIPKNSIASGTDISYAFAKCENLTTCPEIITTGVTNTEYMFYECSNLTTVSLFDTSNVIYMNDMFYRCSNLTTIPNFDTSNVTHMSDMFDGCSHLTTIPDFDTSKVIDMHKMFYMSSTSHLETLPLLKCDSVISIDGIFYTSGSRYPHLTTLGGFENLGKAYSTTQSSNYGSYKLDLHTLTNLTHDSLMNVINNLYDIATAGVAQQSLVLGSTNLAKLTTEEIAIATNKGWAVS